MTKRFCDICEKETQRNYASDRLNLRRTFNGKTVQIQFMVSMDSVWNKGDLCEHCLREVMESGIECGDGGDLKSEKRTA